jgi:hypothetical protein
MGAVCAKGGGFLPERVVDGSGARDNFAPMHWLLHWHPIAALIAGLLLAFLTGRMLRKGGR